MTESSTTVLKGSNEARSFRLASRSISYATRRLNNRPHVDIASRDHAVTLVVRMELCWLVHTYQ